MKCKFLRDYHGPETNEHRYLEGEIVNLADAVVLNFVERRIVISLDEPKAEVKEAAPEKPTAITKRTKKH
jgi:hypothetical protein